MNPRSRPKKAKCLLATCVLLTVAVLCLAYAPSFSAVWQSVSTTRPLNMPAVKDPAWRPWLKESKIKVSAVVFYGRRRYVRILDKYLKQNLCSAGGLLQEVLWVVYTEVAEDIQWLDDVLLPSEPTFYSRVESKGWGYGQHYSKLASDRYYFKVDDDIMYIQPGAVDAMLFAKLQNRFWVVSANVINHSTLTWVHAAIGAMQGYQQDGFDFVPNKTSKAHSFLDGSAFAKMPYRPYDICAIKSFECAATCHYNFLDSLANNDLDKYDFGVWDFHAFEYLRWSINTILFKGSDLNRVKVPDDDEEFISKTLPQSKGRHCGAVGSSAIVVHLAYITQRGVQLEERTHLLQHYEVLAEKLHGPLLPL